MGYRVITFTINDERVYNILERASKYKLRSVLIVRALQSVDLEGLLAEILRELIINEELVKEPPVGSQKPTGPVMDEPESTAGTEEIGGEKVRKLHERFKGMF